MTLGRVAIALLLAALGAAFLSFRGIEHRIALTADQIQAGGGYMYLAALADQAARSDTNETPQRSSLRVLEDGRELGPAHSLHADIIARGAGRYSHYQTHVYFSAGDNTDVRSNGRTYSVVWTWQLERKLTRILAALAAILSGFWIYRRTARYLRAQGPATQTWLHRLALRSPPATRAAAFTGIALLLVTALVGWSGVPREERIEPAKVGLAGGFMYAYAVRRLQRFADENADPIRSSLVVYEDGLRIGPAHTLHVDIMQKGGGRYSHFNEQLYLSATDNSDVRTNGRVYTFTYLDRPALHYLALIAVFAIALTLPLVSMVAGGSLGNVRPSHVALAWRVAKGHWVVYAVTGVAIVQITVLLFSGPETAAEHLDAFRRGVRTLVMTLVGLAGGAAIYFGSHRSSAFLAGPAIARALFLLPLGAIVSMRPCYFTGLVLAGASLAWAATHLGRARFDHWAAAVARDLDRILPRTTEAQVWLLTIGGALLTFVNVVPDVLANWDQSGWMDSRSYDQMGHNIARGSAPLGSSEYAPLYQYWLAAFYWSLGHFFFVQQLANVVLACVTALCMGWAAWFFFHRRAAVLAATLCVAYWSPLHHAVWYTQIENLYVPVVAFSLFALGRFRSRPTRGTALLMGFAAALVFATRQQSAFYVLTLPLAMVIVKGPALRERARQIALYGSVLLAVGVLPWSVRNWYEEGRFSPSTGQSTAFLAIFNDPRIPFHAIRYWERGGEVSAEWKERYPDNQERNKAMQAYFRHRLLHETGYFVAAAPWRLAAFYGVLPGAYLGSKWSENMRVDFRSGWLPQLEASRDIWVPVALSFLALIWRWRRMTSWHFAAMIAANVLVGLLVGSAEPRICYPVLLLHLLLAISLLQPWHESGGSSVPHTPVPVRRWFVSAYSLSLGAGLFASFLHAIIGIQNAYREMPGVKWSRRQDVRIDASLPLVTHQSGHLRVDGVEIGDLEEGKRYRGVFAVSIYGLPPKFVKGLEGLDPALSLPDSVQYYYAFLTEPGSGPILRKGWAVFALRYDGAEVNASVGEYQLIMADFTYERRMNPRWAGTLVRWAKVERAIVTGRFEKFE